MGAGPVGKFESRLSRGVSHINESQLIVEVEKLLGEDPSSADRRERTAFDDAVGPSGQSLVLFGAGGLGRKTLAGLRSVGVEPLAFADNNPRLWGKSVDGLRVLSLEDAGREYGRTAAFVCAIWRAQGTDTMQTRIRQLRAAGCAVVVPFGFLFWKYPGAFLPHYALDLPHKVLEGAPEIRKACCIWGDDASRLEFLAQLRWRTRLDFDGLSPPVKQETYFPDDLFKLKSDEAFIDCGAFDGDTLGALLRRQGEAFASVDSFEPDPTNFKKLADTAAQLPASIRGKVRVHPCAVGSRTETVSFNAQANEASFVGTGTQEVRCVDLDHYLEIAPTYVKMDIEGYEPEALQGASEVIRRNVPILAICVYHRQDHLWRLPLFMQSLSAEYRLFLRPHVLEVWDLVCYAVPRARLSLSPLPQ
jgi:FkbM family methyltransferase